MQKKEILYDIIFFNIKKTISNKAEKEVIKKWES